MISICHILVFALQINLIHAVQVAGITSYAEQYSSSNVFNATDTIPLFSWKATGCAGSGDNNTVLPGKGIPDPVYTDDPRIVAKGDSLVYTRFTEHLCCRKVKVSIERKDSIITLTEYWFNQGCKCRCSSTVSAVIRKLSRGHYRLNLVETGTDPFDNKTILPSTISWSGTFHIK